MLYPSPARLQLPREPPHEKPFVCEGAKSDRLGSTMAPTTHMSEEIYLQSSFKPDADFANGAIKERPPAESGESWMLLAAGHIHFRINS